MILQTCAVNYQPIWPIRLRKVQILWPDWSTFNIFCDLYNKIETLKYNLCKCYCHSNRNWKDLRVCFFLAFVMRTWASVNVKWCKHGWLCCYGNSVYYLPLETTPYDQWPRTLPTVQQTLNSIFSSGGVLEALVCVLFWDKTLSNLHKGAGSYFDWKLVVLLSEGILRVHWVSGLWIWTVATCGDCMHVNKPGACAPSGVNWSKSHVEHTVAQEIWSRGQCDL